MGSIVVDGVGVEGEKLYCYRWLALNWITPLFIESFL